MDFNQIQELIKLISETGLTEFMMEDKDFKLTIRNREPEHTTETKIVTVPAAMPNMSAAYPAAPVAPTAPVAAPAPAATPAAPATEAPKEADNSSYIEIKSPMVGTFYRSPSPDKPVYVKVGDVITKESVVCIVEAMKLFNEIEAEVSGKIVKILVDDASPVEYGQALFLVDPS